MIVVDVLLLVLLALGLAAGIGRGLSGSLGLFAGLVLGGAAAFWLVPIVNDALPTQQWRPALVLATAAALVIGGGALGAAAGSAVRRGVDRVTPLRAIDRVLGGVAGLEVTALALSLAGASLAATGMPVVSTALSSSTVLRTIDRLTPPPVAGALAELRGFVFDEGLPALGDLLDSPAVEIPPVDLADPELARAAASVARVSGTAYSCGRSSTGSGFVVAPDRVVTNAHVVAGVDRPLVELPGVAAKEGRIVYFDPVDDLAVIAVDGLGAAPLPFATTLGAGSAAAVLGYPLGGPFTMVEAGVLSTGTVPIPDIYDESAAPREIYDLRAVVRPGNSGGPLLTQDGAVAGVVFARAEDDGQRGYAMTMTELSPVAAQAADWTSAVSSGRCVA